MAQTKEILIAGAGPSGLSAAIFLSELGYKPRIIDKKSSIDIHSKALAVNAQTLKIFEPLGISKRIFDNALKVPAVNIWKRDKLAIRNEFKTVNGNPPFLLLQPQRESEEILLDEVSKRGINVEYSTTLTSVEKTGNDYKSIINGSEFQSNYIIAADGAHSVIRKQSNLDFAPIKDNGIWELYDVELDMPIAKNEAHVRFYKEGGMIMLPMKNNFWRLAGKLKNLLNYLPAQTTIGNISWQTTFHVSHHLAGQLTSENIVFIGDAAHLHSPIGGRGMNLGIEDAYISTGLLHNGKLNDYNTLRRPYLNKTINRISRLTDTMVENTRLSRFVRNNIAFAKPFFPIVQPNMTRFLFGLDK